MAADEQTLQLDPNPTPKAESQEFSNPDDKRHGIELRHQLDLLDRNQGPLGRLIGCSDTNLTIAFAAIVLLLICVIICLVGLFWQTNPAAFSDVFKLILGVIGTVLGYVFGVSSSQKPEK